MRKEDCRERDLMENTTNLMDGMGTRDALENGTPLLGGMDFPVADKVFALISRIVIGPQPKDDKNPQGEP